MEEVLNILSNNPEYAGGAAIVAAGATLGAGSYTVANMYEEFREVLELYDNPDISEENLDEDYEEVKAKLDELKGLDRLKPSGIKHFGQLAGHEMARQGYTLD